MKNFASPLFCILVLMLGACGGGSAASNAPSNLPSGVLPIIPDTAAPSAPATVATSGSTSDSVSLNWLASTDDFGVVGYEIWRNGARIQVQSASQTTFKDNTLTANTSYTYQVRALDAADNASAFSVDLVVRTLSVSTPAIR